MAREPEGGMQYGTPEFDVVLKERYDDATAETVRLSAELCSIPGISVPAGRADFSELARIAGVAARYAESKGLRVYLLEPGRDAPYPFLVVTFRENDLEDPAFTEAVALIGHLDVVPSRDPTQFSPVLKGDDLFARGSADMKTVAATFLVWMARRQSLPGSKPPFVVLLSCCEENGSDRPHHAASVVRWLHEDMGVAVRFGVVGERTGELEWMGEELAVGPVCVENRSWRWFRVSSHSATGLSALKRFAHAVALCRRTVADLNEETESPLQPGLRSGFLNPFAFIAGAEGVEDLEDAVFLTISRAGGASMHSAVADVSIPSLAERFHDLAVQAIHTFGEGAVHLAGVRIGQEGNYNTYDGSGEMWLAIRDVGPEKVREWIDALDEHGLTLRAAEDPVPVRRPPTTAGLDLRELLDHRETVEDLLSILRGRLWEPCTFEIVHNCPPWRCPADHPDLTRLLAAWRSVTGRPNPDLVKLHGNDGGNLAAWQQKVMPGLAKRGEGYAVVFGQVGRNPHGPAEFHRVTSIGPYLEILDCWAASYEGV